MYSTQIALWRPIDGTGRSISPGNGSNTADTVPMGSETFACQLSVTAANCIVRLSNAATAVKDVLLKTTDPPLLMRCAPGDIVNAYGLGASSVLYIVELTH